MKKQQLISLAVATCMSFSTVASIPVFAEEQASDPITITWWTDFTDTTMLDGIKKYVIEPFEADNPDIKINMESKGDYDRVVQTALATGSGPDVYSTNGPAYSMQFGTDGLALDLAKYAEEYQWSDNIMDWALDACKYKDALYSIPVTTETCFLFYNPDMMEENGWNPPSTFDELTSVCDSMKEKGIIPFAFGASNLKAYNEWWITLAFNYYSGRDNVAKALRGEIPWTSDCFVGAIDMLNDMWQKGYINDKMSHEISSDDALALFGDEKAGFVGWATWLLRFLESYERFDYDFVRWPVWNDDIENSMIVGIGSCWAINAKAEPEKQDAAAKFLNYLLSDKERAANIAVKLNGELWIPMQYDLSDFPEDSDPNFLRVIEEFNTIPEDAPGLSMWTFWPPKFETYLYENIERVWLGEITSEEYLAQGVTIFEEELAEGKVPTIPGR